MSTRRMAYWWFRFVTSGRFLEKFLWLQLVVRRYGDVRALPDALNRAIFG